MEDLNKATPPQQAKPEIRNWSYTTQTLQRDTEIQKAGFSYRQAPNTNRIKSRNLIFFSSRLAAVMPNPWKPGVNPGMKM